MQGELKLTQDELNRTVAQWLAQTRVNVFLAIHGRVSANLLRTVCAQSPGPTVNPKNNLAHCFSCGQNTNDIDLMMLCGRDFVPAVTILSRWLQEYRCHIGLAPVGSRLEA